MFFRGCLLKPEVTISDDLEEFEAKLRAAREDKSGHRSGKSHQGSASGLRHGMEFIGGVLAGALLGWFVDRLFDSAPFGLVVFMLLGFVSGLRSAIRSAKRAAQDAEEDGNDPGSYADKEN